MFTHATCLAAILSVTAMVPATPLVCDQVDMIELNHVYDHDGRPVLQQLVFWDWHKGGARFHVVAWRLWKEDQPRPVYDSQRQAYVLLCYDGEVLRWIESAIFYETWTQYDREIEDRQRLSQDRRRGLTVSSPPSTPAPPRP